MVVDKSKFSKVKNGNNGDLSSEEVRTDLQSSGTVKEITVNMGNTTEGAYLQNLFDKGMGDTLKSCDENGCKLLLNTETAQLQVHTNTMYASGYNFTMSDDPKVVTGGNEAIMIIGSAHTHQAADFASDNLRPASSQMGGDGKTSETAQKVIYSYDSRNVHKITPTKMMGLKSSIPHDNIASTSNLYNGNFSILRDALRTVAKKY